METRNPTKVFLNDKDILDLTWDRVIDVPTYARIITKLHAMILERQEKGLDPLLIIDFTRLEGITPEAAALAASATKDLGCRKIAGFGIKPIAKAVLDGIKERSTKADTIREFASREEAESWLLEK